LFTHSRLGYRQERSGKEKRAFAKNRTAKNRHQVDKVI
jgi:hypothetical protein